MASSYMYHVLRHCSDEGAELRGSYWTVEEANAAARRDLLNEWDRDDFDMYDVTSDSDGMVDIEANIPDGQNMHVYIQKKRAPLPPKSKTSSSNKRGRVMASDADPDVHPHALAPKHIWIIMQTDYEHHTDEQGRCHLASYTSFVSLSEANKAARDLLLEAAGIEDEEEMDVELNEVNTGSAKKPYVGYAYVLQDEVDHIQMEVHKMLLSCSKATRRCGEMVPSGSRPRKRARRSDPEGVIEISD
ncbi:hypothetical protein FIBSPDRAFT_868683 [Athelia psychrophila]|uniref:Uncharacterized protein n=1 Tax=Athelia psychrophila TaxID=1759441 RepID=A0A166CWR0_9AGAM|nr:hypothetical protein FIBSPDRAFT_868683 [Fibularhizoctonia sp. CBS 109695]